MTTVITQSTLRSALSWAAEQMQDNQISREAALEAAVTKFDLSPADSSFVSRHLLPKTSCSLQPSTSRQRR